MKPDYREAEWHPDIPITYAIMDVRPWVEDIPADAPYNQTRINIMGKPPWTSHIRNLEPWTFLEVRVRFGNKYGVGNPSDWVRGNSDWAGKFINT